MAILSPRMIRCRNAGFWLGGWGGGGRGRVSSLAPRGRSPGHLTKTHMVVAITDLDVAGFILSHQHSASARGPVLALSLQLQEMVLVSHHPILTHHPFLLQPE